MDAQIQELQHMIEQIKANPELAEFKREEGELSTLLSQQHVIFY